MLWSGSLIDLQKFTKRGADLYIRLAHSELDKKRDMKVIISVTIVIGTIAIAICTYFLWRWIGRQAVKEKSKEILPSDRGDAYQNYDMNMLGDNVNRVKLEELPLLDFEKLAAATNNFHEANKLGQGGFGPVYRGNLPGGQEIAVKRLSRASAQGQEEFMNEMILISKIQHRNLVRLLGFCIEGDEKLLIYEYMPNKSLDAFLFDPLKRESLDWRRRFSIIEGIGRGLLYPHRDSRLKIIHRDLKASNILLDEDLNAKISDFGMARIFGSNQDQANTMRVVGTYGYMSPEYAMGGQFSEKSDVFSFGVLLLEIAWTLWSEHNIQELIDETIAEACFLEEISRCIHVGLLCVQESAKERPSISTVLSMLSSEIAHLPSPKQPPFLENCLRGYEPKYIEEWSRGNWTSGCVRKTPLQCERTNSSGQQGKLDGFFRLTTVKVPDFADWSLALEDECREQCLKNCSCMAYSYYSGIGCMSWSGNLIDLQKFTQGGADLYIRLANSELDKKKDMKAIISVTIVIGTIAIGICTYFSWRWRRKQTMKDKSKEILLSDRGDAYQIYDMNRLGDNANQVKLEELPLLALEKLATATNNFHEANKLGQGGFGPVYRGKLPGGQEIAVKRLSRASAQGLEEFMNEVMVISKIQHRNLVRLLGCCIEGDEKLLIYEYMPNKSLDAFLF
ncbi:unnamed protein product, partial [Vitis vinifera]